MPAPSRMDAGTASQLIPGVRRLRGERRDRSSIMSTRFCTWILGLCGLAACAAADTAAPLPREMEACSVSLTRLGRQTRFSDSAVFLLEANGTKDSTRVTTVRPPESKSAFLELTAVEECLSRWRLSPGTRYTVVLQFGTTDELLKRWVLSLSDRGGEVTRILLPRELARE